MPIQNPSRSGDLMLLLAKNTLIDLLTKTSGYSSAINNPLAVKN